MPKPKIPPAPKKQRSATKEELLALDKEDLVRRIFQLESHNTQLKNLVNKKVAGTSGGKDNARKNFDFTKCYFRRVLIRILYFGWNYQGFTVQEGITETIEHHLFQALVKSCLIESRDKSMYHRCGRTDKGVSAFGQVISLTIRSKHHPDQQHRHPALETELKYCKILNRLLPPDIRAVSWMPIPRDMPEFSARFDCKSRQYKYYFPQSDLDVAAMRDACARAVGWHDFRHLCKMDVANGVTAFRREIRRADIQPVDEDDADLPTSMYCLTIEGNAFLWHQIRCIMGVLLLVGQGLERPSVVSELLDVETLPRKPQYSMAWHVPLTLFSCSYHLGAATRWVYDRAECRALVAQLQTTWTAHAVKTAMIKDVLEHLEGDYATLVRNDREAVAAGDSGVVAAYADTLLQGVRPKVYKPLMAREMCSSLEERIEHYKKKRRMNTESDQPSNAATGPIEVSVQCAESELSRVKSERLRVKSEWLGVATGASVSESSSGTVDLRVAEAQEDASRTCVSSESNVEKSEPKDDEECMDLDQ